MDCVDLLLYKQWTMRVDRYGKITLRKHDNGDVDTQWESYSYVNGISSVATFSLEQEETLPCQMWTWPKCAVLCCMCGFNWLHILNHKTGIVQVMAGRCMSVTYSATQMHSTLCYGRKKKGNGCQQLLHSMDSMANSTDTRHELWELHIAAKKGHAGCWSPDLQCLESSWPLGKGPHPWMAP